MPRPICVPCARGMSCAKNGYLVHMLLETGEPYQIYSGDMWECGSCGTQAVIGFGNGPVAEHFDKESFESYLPEVDLEVK